MTETDTSRDMVECWAGTMKREKHLEPHNVLRVAWMMEALLNRAEKAEAERDEWRNQAKRYKSQVISLLNDRLDGTWRDQVEQDAWNDAIEAAAEKALVSWCAEEAEGRIISDSILTLRKGDPT